MREISVITILTEEDLSPIEARLTALEAVAGQASTEVEALEGRVAALEELTAPEPVQHALLLTGEGTHIDYVIEVSGDLEIDPAHFAAQESDTIIGGNSTQGYLTSGSDGFFYTGDLVKLALSGPEVDVTLDGVALTASDYVVSEAPPAEPLPDPTGDVSVVSMDYIGDDSHTYTMGWASALPIVDPDSGRTLFMPLFGHGHNPYGDNSMRGYDPVSGAWTQYQGNTGQSDQWTTYVCNRDNYIAWYVPWRGEVWVVGGAGSFNNGIFDLSTRTWTVYDGHWTFGTGVVDVPVEVDQPWHNYNPATAVCPELQTLVFYGGEILGNPKNRLVLIEPKDGGPEPFKYTELTGPLAVMRCRNNMVIDGTTCYFTGGTVKDASGNSVLSKQTYKLDLVTRTWTRLADAPTMTDYPVVTWDAGIKRMILFSGEGRRLLMSYDPAVDAWTDLSAQLPNIGLKNGLGTYIDGVHYYRGGTLYQGGVDQGWSRSRRVHALKLQAAAATTGVGIETVPWGAAKPSMKHTKVLEYGGKIYMNGGDFAGPGHVQSYRQDMYTLDLATKAWAEEHPYCAVSPDVQPKGPDMCGWIYAGRPGKLLMIPGIQDVAADNTCPGVAGKAMEFDTATQKWAEVSGQNALTGVVSSAITDNLPTFWLYDSATDAAYSVGYQGEILKYDCSTVQFSRVRGNPFGVSVDPKKQFTALMGREIVLLDANVNKMVAYHIDTGLGRVVNTPPFTVEQENCYVAYLPWLGKLFIHNFDKGNAGNCSSWLYDPATDSYEQLSLVDGAGRVVRCRTLCVDETNRQIFMGGHNDYPSWDSPKDPAWLVRL